MSEPDAVHPPVFCYRLLALKSAGVAPRVIEYFAKRDLVPERFDCRAGAETLAIEVEVAGLEDAAARHIARCLANIVEVERVAVAHLRPLGRPQAASAAKTEGLRASA